MKKLTILFSMLLVSAFTFGQPTPTQQNQSLVNETGNNQYAKVYQEGEWNVSTVDQSNALNQAFVNQIGAVNLRALVSDIDQSGVGNKAETQQNTTDATKGNDGFVKAIVNQWGNYNRSFQNQGPVDQEGNSTVTILQGGNDNYASQNQIRYDNVALINQSGSNNIAEQGQDINLTSEQPGSSNEADIYQSGNFNQSYQHQDGWANLLTADQSGSFNYAKQDQQDYSWKSIGAINQSGNSNQALQTQLGPLNKASIEQSSSLNSASQTQTVTGKSRSGNADYDPYNEGIIIQRGNDQNYAVQTQTSPGNDAIVNFASITQDGFQNVSTQTQTGGFNSSIETQNGNYNHIEVTQVHP